MAAIEELREVRIKKLNDLKKAGGKPYPSKVHRTQNIGSALKHFWFWRLIKKELRLAGRIRTIRVQRKAAFFDLEDASGRIQCFISPSGLKDKKTFDKFIADFDIGDFVEAGGVPFRTKKGEKTIKVNFLRMIVKALLPLPEKWHGLKDVEERYRKRYLDLLMNPEVKAAFLTRFRVVSGIRNFFESRGFVEFETPILQILPGGATARPFKTHLNSLDLDLYLRVAPELFLKRLLVGGYENVFEIGRNFRNEGMDSSHNPEFTMLEAYIAYKDSPYLKIFIPELFRSVIGRLNNGNLIIKYEENQI